MIFPSGSPHLYYHDCSGTTSRSHHKGATYASANSDKTSLNSPVALLRRRGREGRAMGASGLPPPGDGGRRQPGYSHWHL